jgi:hypothetical protein
MISDDEIAPLHHHALSKSVVVDMHFKELSARLMYKYLLELEDLRKMDLKNSLDNGNLRKAFVYKIELRLIERFLVWMASNVQNKPAKKKILRHKKTS